MGSRSSGRFIRVYDRRGPTRLEIEFKNDWAENFIKVISSVQQTVWIEQCMGLLCDYVDFVDRSHNCGGNAAHRLQWWESIVGHTEKISIGSKKDTERMLLSRTKAWFERMIPMLYLVRHGLGISLDELIDRSEWRLKNRRLRKLEVLRKSIR